MSDNRRQSECTHPYHTMGHGLRLSRCEHLGDHFIDEWDGGGYFSMGLHNGLSVNPQYNLIGNRNWLLIGACAFGEDGCCKPGHGGDRLPMEYRELMWETMRSELQDLVEYEDRYARNRV